MCYFYTIAAILMVYLYNTLLIMGIKQLWPSNIRHVRPLLDIIPSRNYYLKCVPIMESCALASSMSLNIPPQYLFIRRGSARPVDEDAI